MRVYSGLHVVFMQRYHVMLACRWSSPHGHKCSPALLVAPPLFPTLACLLQLNLFCAAVGAGAQLFTMTLCLLSMALLGVFAPSKRGSIVTACIVLYTLCAGVGGFVSARLYRQLHGENWAWNIVLATFMFPGACVRACVCASVCGCGFGCCARPPPRCHGPLAQAQPSCAVGTL